MNTNRPGSGLPLRDDKNDNNKNPPRRVIIASHLIWTGYGHWLPNDPRGSGSGSIRKDELEQLGPILRGRQLIQPLRPQLKAFHQNAKPLLEHQPLWFTSQMRQLIGDAMGRAVVERGYTVFAFAVCSNHVHAVIRTHRDHSEVVWSNLASSAKDALLQSQLVPSNHPVWATRPYKVFLRDDREFASRIDYVNRNPVKEHLPVQNWTFVK